jgi:hypothetical protein
MSLAVAATLTGCFYRDDINQRPSADIHPTSSNPVFRNDTVVLDSIVTDPDSVITNVLWQVFTCTDAVDLAGGCDADSFDTDVMPELTFMVPPNRLDGVTPTRALRVLLDAQDEYGALARPQQELVIPVDDHAPDLDLRQLAAHDGVVDSHVKLFVEVTDPDDSPNAVTVDFTVDPPIPNADFGFDPLPPQQTDPQHLILGRSLLPHDTGDWTVHVTATDPLGQMTQKDFALVVGPDLPGCITAPSPIASPTESIPLVQATQFQVPIVIDDLDVYPPQADQDLGVASFAWSIKNPGSGSFEDLPTFGNATSLDPASYTPGDVVELRVEIGDRVDRTMCPASQPTCALDAARPDCFQRVTWTVNVK